MYDFIVKDASLNRILFVKDLPVLIKKISQYYEDIKERPTPPREELREEFNKFGQVCKGGGGVFNIGYFNLILDVGLPSFKTFDTLWQLLK